MRLRLLVREKFDVRNVLEARRVQRAAELAAKEAEAKEVTLKKKQRQREEKERRRASKAEGGLVSGLFGG